MNVALVSVTPQAEKTMMYCARVSNPNNQHSENTNLLSYCIKHNHWSVFEMANMVIEIETSRAIAAQILRHRSFSFQEFSQRYAEIHGFANEFQAYDARSQDNKNRQNSNDDLSQDDKDWFHKAIIANQVYSMNLYKKALAKGIAKECARFLLPLNVSTRLYMNGSVRSWLHYLDLRCGNGTQLEHKQIADKIKEVFCQQFPVIARAKGWITEGDQNASQG